MKAEHLPKKEVNVIMERSDKTQKMINDLIKKRKTNSKYLKVE